MPQNTLVFAVIADDLQRMQIDHKPVMTFTVNHGNLARVLFCAQAPIMYLFSEVVLDRGPGIGVMAWSVGYIVYIVCRGLNLICTSKYKGYYIAQKIF